MSKIGLQIPNFTFDAPDTELFGKVVELAIAAEETGFDSVWVMDHFYQLPPLGGPERPMLEAYTLLGALGARTSRVRLGALVGGVTYRNPALVAKEATTLDVITGGRAILGLGAAWYDVEHDALGFDFPPAGERIDRLEEAAHICRAMFTEEAPSFEGRYYRIREARNVPRPIQPGGPPIMIGGGGEKRTLRAVARYADMWNFIGDAQTYAQKLETLRRHCDEAGRNYDTILKTRLSTLVLTDTEEQTRATLEMLAQVAGQRGVGGFNVGTEKEILGQLEELESVGVEYFIFNMPLSTAEQVRRVGEMLGGI
jgi:F420-dependent oxidoreductase-like protein